MRGSLPVRRSRLADWARLAGALSLPVGALALLGALVGLVDAGALYTALGAGFALALLAIVLAVCALASIWMSGAFGARSAFIAILYAGPALAILATGLAATIVYPRLNDVSTDPVDPPRFVGRPADEPPPDRQKVTAQMIAYPDLSPRLYDRPVADIRAAAAAIVEERGWIAANGSLPAVEGAAGTAETVASIEAAVPMPLFGFSGAVVVRMRETLDGTRVDMRSTWGGGAHDFGQNARRIKAFFADLDERLAAG